MYTVESEPGEIFDIELDENLKRANDQIAEENQRLLQKHGVQAIDIMGSIGSGKTSLIEHLVRQLRDKYRIAAFKGEVLRKGAPINMKDSAPDVDQVTKYPREDSTRSRLWCGPP